MQVDSRHVGSTYAVTSEENGNCSYVQNKNGSIKTFSSYKRAQNYADKYGGVVKSLELSEMYVIKPVGKYSKGTESNFKHIPSLLSSGLAKVYKDYVMFDTEYNIIRHTKLGHKPSVQVGDQTVVIRAEVWLTVDSVEYQKWAKKQFKDDV